MTELTRFSLDSGQMDSDGDGSWVRYEDVQELLKELEEKTESLGRIKDIPNRMWGSDWEEIEEAREVAGKVLQKYNNI